MKVDYLYGRSVKDVRKKAGGGYTVEFEDGAKLFYEDSDADIPEHIEGHIFTMASFAPDKTTLYFGKKLADGEMERATFKVELAPMLVGVQAHKGEVHWPARTPEEETPLPPDPSPQRVSEGLTEPQEDE